MHAVYKGVELPCLALTGVTVVVSDGEVDLAGAPLLIVFKKCGRDMAEMWQKCEGREY